MQIKLSFTSLKYGFNALCALTMLLTVLLISNGVLAFGGAGSMTGAYMIASVGFIIISLEMFGGYASLRESKSLSQIYMFATGACVIFDIVYMIAFAAMKSEFMERTGDRIANFWELELQKSGSMDWIHVKYNCCGKESPQDFLKKPNDVLPKSCCLGNDCSDDDNVKVKGCLFATINLFDKYSDHLILTFVGLIALQVLSVVAAHLYRKKLFAKKERGASISE